MKILPRNVALTKKQIITKTLRANSRIASLMLCVIALLTCVSVTFAWFGSTFENLNTVITMGDYTANFSIFDTDCNELTSMTASNGEDVSFDNTLYKDGWSSGDVSAYYIYADNTGDIDIKTYLSFACDFVSETGEDLSENIQYFAFYVKDISDACTEANGMLNYIRNNELPSSNFVKANGFTFADASSVLAGTVESKNCKAFALYYCCYNLPDEYVSSENSFMMNTTILTSQAGMPASNLLFDVEDVENKIINSVPETTVATTPSTEKATTPKGTEAEEVTESTESSSKPAKKDTWVWKYNDESKKTVTVTEYNGHDKNITVPSVAKGALVTGLARGFVKSTAVEKITVPACVSDIHYDAFCYANVKSVNIQNRTTVNGKVYTSPYKSVDSVIYNADMTALVKYLPSLTAKEFKVPASVNTIYDNAFSGTSKLKTVSIKNVNYFSSLTFYGSSITDIKLYNDNIVMSAGDDVFGDKAEVTIHVLTSHKESYKTAPATNGYKVKADLKSDIYQNYKTTESNGLKYMILNSGDMYKGIEYDLKGYSQFVIVIGYTSIPDDGTVVIPESIICDGKGYQVAGIADEAFKNCKGLKKVVLPNNKVEYSSNAFDGCNNLGSIQLDDAIVYNPPIKDESATETETTSEEAVDPTNNTVDTEPTE